MSQTRSRKVATGIQYGWARDAVKHPTIRTTELRPAKSYPNQNINSVNGVEKSWSGTMLIHKFPSTLLVLGNAMKSFLFFFSWYLLLLFSFFPFLLFFSSPAFLPFLLPLLPPPTLSLQTHLLSIIWIEILQFLQKP